jgi:aspartate racemase
MPPGNPSLDELEEAIERYGVTTLWLTAGFFHVIVDERLTALRSVRELLAGGDVLSVPHVERLLRELPDCRVINGYGPTENTTFSCCKRIAPASRFRGSVPIGRPIANTRVYVLDPHRQPVPIGVPGELYVGGDGVALGYLRRPELTAERFLPDPFDATPGAQFYRTGDLVRYLPDGDIEFLGRLDDQVKIRGFRVEPGEIESILSRDDTIRECAVVVREDARTAQKMLVAYFVSSSDEESLSINNLRKALAAKLPQYMIPQVFMQLPTLPKTQNGKVDRSALPDPVSPSESRAEEQTPVTELEALLAEIWSNVLGVESVSANDNFFDLGGNSLLAVRVVHRLREQRGVRVNPLVLFSGSLRQTAEAIEEIMPPSETVPGGFSLRRIVASVTQNINRLVNSRQ